MKSVMRHLFSEVPSVGVQRSSFDRSHGLKTTFDAGYLYPIFLDEALPGDTFNLSMTAFARLATPIHPIMDNIRLETFFFFVPLRLIWDNFKKFMGERANPTDTIDYTVPQVTHNNGTAGQLSDYFGLPTKVAAEITVSALPFRAYNLIWNEWFRDENLQTAMTVSKSDTVVASSTFGLLRRGKRHDYFTSALPWTQKGDDVLLSLGDYAPVKGIGKSNPNWGAGVNVNESYETDPTAYAAASAINDLGVDTTFYVEKSTAAGDDHPMIRADLSMAVGPSVNDLRQAIQTQRILEKDARAGTRYTEIIQSHFGVKSPDARLQRSEYLGGGSTPVNITPVANTSNTGTGTLAATGLAAARNHGFTRSFTEHGLIIGLVNARADLTYQQGVDRMWSRRTRYDFYWPTLAHLGEQTILNKEIYLSAATVGDGSYNNVFGYQERYAEYRYKPSKITGAFRSNDTGTLDSWHLATEYSAQPALDATFIQDDPPIDRAIATPSEPHFYMDCYFNLHCARPMPVYSIPGMIDHF